MQVDVGRTCLHGVGGDGGDISCIVACRTVKVVGGDTAWGTWGACAIGGGECLLGRNFYGDGVAIVAIGFGNGRVGIKCLYMGIFSCQVEGGGS